MTDLLQHALKQKCVADNLKRRYDTSKSLRDEVLMEKKRFSAGLLFKTNKVCLDQEVHRHDLTLEQHLKEQGKEINEMIAENMHQEGEEEDESIAASSEHDETQQFGRI